MNNKDYINFLKTLLRELSGGKDMPRGGSQEVEGGLEHKLDLRYEKAYKLALEDVRDLENRKERIRMRAHLMNLRRAHYGFDEVNFDMGV